MCRKSGASPCLQLSELYRFECCCAHEVDAAAISRNVAVEFCRGFGWGTLRGAASGVHAIEISRSCKSFVSSIKQIKTLMPRLLCGKVILGED
jgi:hypothetical protein